MEQLTTKQQSLLNEFKKIVKDVDCYYSDDAYMVRWLIARDWDLKKSEKMFRDSMEWRKQYGADTLLDTYESPEVLKRYLAGGYHGCDRLGHPVWYELIGLIDVRGLLYSVPKKDIIRYRIYLTEHIFRNRFPECSKKYGKRIDQTVFIVDLEGVGTKHMWMPAVSVYTELLAMVEANYPETLYRAYVINAPSIFPLLYALVKNFLAPSTRDKIRILGKNWKEALQKDIPADQIPVHWGGTATDTDGDIHCKSKICIGGTIPEKYSMKSVKSENVSTEGFSNITVGKASSTSLDYNVTLPNSVLRWNFWTDDKDISFGVYRRTGDSKQISDMEEVVTNSRVNCHMVPEADSFICEKPGTYVVHFDNTYSWINSKKLSYKIEILEPDSGKELKYDQTNL